MSLLLSRTSDTTGLAKASCRRHTISGGEGHSPLPTLTLTAARTVMCGGLASLKKSDRSLMTPILTLGHNGNRSLVNTTDYKLHESPSYKALYRRFAVLSPGITQRLQQALHHAFLGSYSKARLTRKNATNPGLTSWSGRQDSNLRSPAPKAGALATTLRPVPLRSPQREHQ